MHILIPLLLTPSFIYLVIIGTYFVHWRLLKFRNVKIYGLYPGKPHGLVGRIDHKLEKELQIVKCSEKNKNGAVIGNGMETSSDLELSRNISPWNWDFSRSKR